jgi:hypothetical protein
MDLTKTHHPLFTGFRRSRQGVERRKSPAGKQKQARGRMSMGLQRIGFLGMK